MRPPAIPPAIAPVFRAPDCEAGALALTVEPPISALVRVDWRTERVPVLVSTKNREVPSSSMVPVLRETSFECMLAPLERKKEESQGLTALMLALEEVTILEDKGEEEEGSAGAVDGGWLETRGDGATDCEVLVTELGTELGADDWIVVDETPGVVSGTMDEGTEDGPAACDVPAFAVSRAVRKNGLETDQNQQASIQKTRLQIQRHRRCRCRRCRHRGWESHLQCRHYRHHFPGGPGAVGVQNGDLTWRFTDNESQEKECVRHAVGGRRATLRARVEGGYKRRNRTRSEMFLLPYADPWHVCPG